MNLVKDGTKVQAKAQTAQARAQTAAHRGIANAKVAATRAGAKARVAGTKARVRARTSDAPGSKKALGAAGAVGAVGAFFLDPQQGARRRNMTRDRVIDTARRASERMRRRAEHGRTTVEGRTEAAGSEPNAAAPTYS
jgi:hypothetical protein